MHRVRCSNKTSPLRIPRLVRLPLRCERCGAAYVIHPDAKHRNARLGRVPQFTGGR